MYASSSTGKYKQGGAINHGQTCIFSMYKPSCLIEAYVGPEKNWLVCWAVVCSLWSSDFYKIFENCFASCSFVLAKGK